MIGFEIPETGLSEAWQSPLFVAAFKTLTYANETGPIGLTATGAFKRTFVHWAAAEFHWPHMSEVELFRFNKVLNEQDFTPLWLLHQLLIDLKLGRHYKGTFRITKRGKAFLDEPHELFRELVPYFLLNIVHSSYGRLDEDPIGSWDVWLNVINVEVDAGASEDDLYSVFYGPVDHSLNWRAHMAFICSVLRPLCWAGFLSEIRAKGRKGGVDGDSHYVKTDLWRAVLKLETDDQLSARRVH